MHNTSIKLHLYQQKIVKALTLQPTLRFNDLLIEGLESEHMNYHLKKLIELGLVEKVQEGYALTDSGKDYSNLLDDNIEIIEKQPKASVLIRAVRYNEEKGEIEHLLNRRLRHPYFGKVGRLTGKIRFGETLEEAVKRELFEEAGLHCERVVLEEVYRKMRKREEFVQDVFFYTCHVTGFSGTLIEKTLYQENFWITPREIAIRTDLDMHESLELNDSLEPRVLRFVESVGVAEGF